MLKYLPKDVSSTRVIAEETRLFKGPLCEGQTSATRRAGKAPPVHAVRFTYRAITGWYSTRIPGLHVAPLDDAAWEAIHGPN